MSKASWSLLGCVLCLSLGGCEKGFTDSEINSVADVDAGESGADVDSGVYVSTGSADEKDWTPGAAEPCDIDTGYPGDEFCIKPPPAGKGFQLHYGPSNYDDPDEVAKYLLMPGEETTDCIFGATPNETEIFHNEYHGRMRPGSHHLLVYTEDGGDISHPSIAPESCSQGPQTRNIFGSQTPTVDLVAGANGAPENQGLAQRLGPKQRSVLQLHFINTGDKPILREAWTNIIYVDKSKVKVQADPIFFLGGLADNIKPGVHTITKGKAVAQSALRLVEATGHFHAHTVRFSAWKTIGGVRTLLFEDYNWHEPSMFPFDSKTKNRAPDPKNKLTGALSGILNLEKGDMIDWECEVDNDSEYTLGFGNEVFKAEMCNMFGVYTPGTGKPWQAINF